MSGSTDQATTREVKQVDGRGVEVIDGLTYSHAGGRSRLADLYLPNGAARPLPVIVWLHGGGWRLGDRKLGPDLTRFFAASGFAMCSIDYRLSDEAIFPAQIEDVKCAIRWLRSVSEIYRLDAAHIGLWGSSAGGHLAALAATSGPGKFETAEHANYSSTVSAVVDGYGPIDFLQIDSHRHWVGAGGDAESARLGELKPSAHPESFESLLVGGPIGERGVKVREANPITYVGSDAPPFLILHGTKDSAVPVHQSELLFNALVASGIDATLCLIDGLGHGFLNKNDWDKRAQPMEVRTVNGSTRVAASITTIEEFFRRHLLGEGDSK